MVQWSYADLPSTTQQVFARLGVFASSLTLAAAEVVASDQRNAPADVLGHVTTLVDHSLLGPGTGLDGDDSLPAARDVAHLRPGAFGGVRGDVGRPPRPGPDLYPPPDRGGSIAPARPRRDAVAIAARSRGSQLRRRAGMGGAARPGDGDAPRRQPVAVLEPELERNAAPSPTSAGSSTAPTSTCPKDMLAWALTAAGDLAGNAGDATACPAMVDRRRRRISTARRRTRASHRPCSPSGRRWATVAPSTRPMLR